MSNKFKYLVKFCLKTLGFNLSRVESNTRINIVEATEYDLETLRIASGISMQSVERLWALINSTRFIVQNNIPGDFVECGVYKGSSAVVIARTLISLGIVDRKIWLYDTYQGMTEPTKFDKKHGTDLTAKELLDSQEIGNGENIWAYSSIENVVKILGELDYPIERFLLVKGDVALTLNQNVPDCISLLRLDTDWYESTRFELETLYPLVSPGGVVIIDDYGHWSGSKKAVDEFLEDQKLAPLKHYLDYGGRLWTK